MPSMAPSTPEERSLPPPKGPHPSFIETAKPYIFEHQIQKMLRTIGISEAAEENSRVHGVSWIDNVRRFLLLPVRTYDTACIYYHKFRLTHRDEQYDYRSAAAAALFCACKIEDTPKKSRDILAAAYNLHKASHEHLTSDASVRPTWSFPFDDANTEEQFFDESSKTIHVLERLMLESSGFDFRNRYPQKLLVKIGKHTLGLPKEVGFTAFDASLDLYRTFAPIKQTTQTMALASLELAMRLHSLDAAASSLADGSTLDLARWSTSRAEILETLLDLLEMYAHNSGKGSAIGAAHPLDALIPITIALRKEREAKDLPRHTMAPRADAADAHDDGTPASPGDAAAAAAAARANGAIVTPKSISPQSPAPGGGGASAAERGRDGTVRFLLDPERAIEEKKIVRDFFTPVEVTEYV